MEILKELVHILTLNKTKKIRQYGFLQDESGRLLQFYEGLVKDKWTTDEAAAQEILGLDAKHKTYRRLKNSLKKELLTAFLFLDTDNNYYTDFQRAYYSSNRQLAQLNILIGQTARKTAISLGKELLKKSMSFDLTLLILESARSLRRINAAYVGNEKEHKYLTSIIVDYTSILKLEVLAENIYTSIGINYSRSKEKKTYLFEEFHSEYQEIRKYFKKINSHFFHFFGYLSGVSIYMSIDDFEVSREICQDAIDYFENKKFIDKGAIATFAYQLIVCNIQLKKFNEASLILEKSYPLIPKGKHGYFRTLENHLLLSFYTKEYDQAYDLLQTAKKTKGFKFLLPTVKERWILHEAYVQFLVEVGKAKGNPTQDKKFKIQKFLNDVPTFTQDKRGMNIPVLLLQVLFLWNRKKFDEALQRIENLKKYNTRYLQEEDTMRTTHFIKMLQVAATEGFAPRATKKAVQPLYKEMTSRDIVFANQSAELEYIPYEDLWAIGMKILEAG